jgi:hypothetical protein
VRVLGGGTVGVEVAVAADGGLFSGTLTKIKSWSCTALVRENERKREWKDKKDKKSRQKEKERNRNEKIRWEEM